MHDTDLAEPRIPLWQRHGRRLRGLGRGLLLVLAALAVLWWLRFAPLEVRVHGVTRGELAAEVLGTGTLEARVSSAVGAKVGGLLVELAVDEGERVTAGALLFRLEDGDLRQQVRMAEAEVEAARATLARLEASLRGAQAVLDQALANHRRIEELTARDVVSAQDLERAFESLSVAQADVSVAEAGLLEGRRRLDAAERGLEYQLARLEDTTIEAPFDGLVVRRERELGDVVAPGSRVLQLAATDPLWIEAWVDETELARLAEGQPARVVFRSEPEVEYPGVVARIRREVDRETREVEVDVRVERLPATWALGQRAEVYVRVDRREGVTLLPAGLVLVRDGRTGVLVDAGGRAAWRAITVGLRGRESVEVSAGLLPGERVLLPTPGRAQPVREGRRIRPR